MPFLFVLAFGFVFFFLLLCLKFSGSKVLEKGSCFLKKQLKKFKYCCHGTVNPNMLQKPCHFTLHTLMRYKLRDLFLNGFMGDK